MPRPRRFDNGRDIGMDGMKLEDLLARAGVSHQYRGIAGTARLDERRNGSAGLRRNGAKDFPDRKPCSGAQIVDTALMAAAQQLQRQQMSPSKINHVYVVANRGAVGGRVVVAKNRKICDVSLQGHQRTRDKMRLG